MSKETHIRKRQGLNSQGGDVNLSKNGLWCPTGCFQKKNCRTEKCISKSSIERYLCGLRNTSPCFVTKDLISRFYLQNCQGNPEKKSKAGAYPPRLQAIITKL